LPCEFARVVFTWSNDCRGGGISPISKNGYDKNISPSKDHVEMIWRLADICLISKLKYIFYGHNEKEITKTIDRSKTIPS